MNEVQFYRMEEMIALGQSLLQLLGTMFNCEDKEDAIKSQVYKNTDCGAWIAFTETGVKIGSIVEGCDHDGTQSHDIPYTGDDDKFQAEFWQCMELVEQEADLLWHEYNGEA